MDQGIDSFAVDAQPATMTPTEAKKSINWWGFILWPFVTVIFYVLSFGPVVMMYNKNLITRDNKVIWAFYEPLEWAADNTPLHKPLGMYLHLWAPGLFDRNGNEVIKA